MEKFKIGSLVKIVHPNPLYEYGTCDGLRLNGVYKIVDITKDNYKLATRLCISKRDDIKRRWWVWSKSVKLVQIKDQLMLFEL